MKKLFATIFLFFCLFGSFDMTVNASTTQEDFLSENLVTKISFERGHMLFEPYDMSLHSKLESNLPVMESSAGGFDFSSNLIREYALEYFENTGELINWCVISYNNHQNTDIVILNGEPYWDKLLECSLFENDFEWILLDGFFDKFGLQAFKESIEKDSKVIPLQYQTYETSKDIAILELVVGRYTVKQGDNLTKIAKQYNTTVNCILNANPQLKDPNIIHVDDYITITTVK